MGTPTHERFCVAGTPTHERVSLLGRARHAGARALGVLALAAGVVLSAPAPAAAQADSGEAMAALARDLELVISETGPEQPWTLHLQNRGSTSIGVMADPGLLWFEVTPPGTGATQICRLPEPLWPKAMRRRAEVVLQPGQRFSRRFDPRFFCFAELVQTALVPGARVTPRFGWPHETRSTTVGGKRVEQVLPARAPFVAWPMPASAAAPADPEPAQPAEGDAPLASEPESDEDEASAPPAEWQLPSEGLKNIGGSTLVLSPAYARWSERPRGATDGMVVGMLGGSDAEDERGAVVTVGIGNAGTTPQIALVRRELLSFDVLGPDGGFECPTGDMGPPDVASFTTLAPRASQHLVVRLIEMCPRGSFSRPGLYEVRATWHAKFSGESANVDAFVGEVTSPAPALVRVRSGERSSFLRALPLVAPNDAAGAAPDHAGEAPPETMPESPAEEAPMEAPAPEEAPPPDPAPTEGTSVE